MSNSNIVVLSEHWRKEEQRMHVVEAGVEMGSSRGVEGAIKKGSQESLGQKGKEQ